MTVENTPNPSTPPPGALTVYPASLYPSWWDSATTIVIDTNHGSTPEIPRGNVEIFPWGVAFLSTVEGDDNTLYSWTEVQDIHMSS